MFLVFAQATSIFINRKYIILFTRVAREYNLVNVNNVNVCVYVCQCMSISEKQRQDRRLRSGHSPTSERQFRLIKRASAMWLPQLIDPSLLSPTPPSSAHHPPQLVSLEPGGPKELLYGAYLAGAVGCVVRGPARTRPRGLALGAPGRRGWPPRRCSWRLVLLSTVRRLERVPRPRQQRAVDRRLAERISTGVVAR